MTRRGKEIIPRCDKSQDTDPSWRVIWCCERCFKAEEETLRQAVRDCARRLDGRFTCFKKSKAFSAWLSQRWQPHVLLSDGREIKPCVQALCGTLPSKWPLLIVVLQPNPVHAARTTAWAAKVSAEGFPLNLHVVSDIDELSALLCQHVCLNGRGTQNTQQALIAATEPSTTCLYPRVTGDASTRVGVRAAMPLFISPEIAMTTMAPAVFMTDLEAVSKMLADAQPEVYEE
eukprot:CAMPEP_0176081652 /NCGR_PEP_ID=MMETSP0120_2-20121206/40843_1 /TAXON_ID=160619 /ORGANISM="Kryptoperidinium foliaceum, Strain CCMP 1326" /LENGTH=230 /DNA_ID=CAMNT_0017415419 /DNA_START=3 /DNA_END=695 /DNA_ORIENTATION=+